MYPNPYDRVNDGGYVIDQEICIECLSWLDECPSEAIAEQ